MLNFEETRALIGDVLQLGERTAEIHEDTLLLGSIPEFDSMAVVSLITAIEDRFGIAIDDDELIADTFASAGSLHAFIAARVD
ncbi:MAG TPA: acyl carrier protein [Plasticicumulans sp.]|nr:acyl carrier protein [Plasticicumulans sp.]